MAAFTDGDITETETPLFWAITDGASVLLETGPVANPQLMTQNGPFNSGVIDSVYPNAVQGP